MLRRRKTVHLLEATDALNETLSVLSDDTSASAVSQTTACTQCTSCSTILGSQMDMSPLSEGSACFCCDECKEGRCRTEQPNSEGMERRHHRILRRCRTWMHDARRGRLLSDRV